MVGEKSKTQYFAKTCMKLKDFAFDEDAKQKIKVPDAIRQ